MELGLIGLGKMGGNMRERLRAKGHTVVGYDQNQEISDASSTADMVARLTQSPKVVWVMVPEKAVDPVVGELKGLLGEGDIVIDGGNSKWTNDKRHAADLALRRATDGLTDPERLNKLAAWFDAANRTRDLLRTTVRADLAVVELLLGWTAANQVSSRGNIR